MHDIQFPSSLNSASFLEGYWQKKPLYMPQAWPDFENPFPADELAGLALEEDIPSRIIECQAGNQWTVRHGPFTANDFDQLEGKVWSLLVTDVEKHLPELMRYVQPFRFISDWRFDDLMISYAPPGGSVGPHMDDYDVFLIQVEGQRRWLLEDEFRHFPLAQESLIEGTDLRLIKDFNVAQDLLCQPGDMLYLPPRLGHHGIAKSSDQGECMTWSIGFKAPSFQDVLLAYVEDFEALNEHQRFTDPSLQLQSYPGEITEQQVQSLKTWFMRQMKQDDAAFARWVGRFLSRDACSDGFNEEELGDLSAVTTKLRVVPDSFVSFKFIRLERQTYLYVAGEEYAVSAGLAQQLSSKSVVSLIALTNQDKSVVKKLLRKGYLSEE